MKRMDINYKSKYLRNLNLMFYKEIFFNLGKIVILIFLDSIISILILKKLEKHVSTL